MTPARRQAMTEIEAIEVALTRFDGSAAARIDWETLFPVWETAVRQRYVHNTRTVATGVLCPEKRPGCYQELRENAETGEWRAVCSRDSEECARRTLTRQQATVWALDVQTLCQDIADSLKTGANPYKLAPGVWECGKLRIDKKQYAGILFVVGGDGLSERLEYARGGYDGTGIVIPSIEKANNGLLALCENCGAVMFGIAEHCRIERGRIVANSLEVWTKELAGAHGSGMKAGVWMDTPRGMTVGGRLIEEGAEEAKPQVEAVSAASGAAGAGHERFRISKRGVKLTRFNNASFKMTTWRCRFAGRDFDLPDLIASTMLVELLRRPGVALGAEELLAKLQGEAAVVGNAKDFDWLGRKDEDGKDDVFGSVRGQVADRHIRWDDKMVRGVVDRIRQLNSEIADCGDDPGTASERTDLEDELERLSGELRRNTKLGAGGMPISKAFDGDRAKAGNLVGKHMRNLLEQLRVIDESLWKHLSNRAIFKYGQTCQYVKQNGYEWHIE